jgi:dipeptidase D
VSSALLGTLEPPLVWRHFAELTQIARPSKAEGPARDYVLAWAAERGFEAMADAEGNVVVRVPASRGHEDAATAVLQSHLDIVCERDPESPFDPRDGRISVLLDDDWVLADGTTLGADNGIGVAAAMAVAEDDTVAHGSLELLFTVSEEQGLDGAKGLDAALVLGRLLVNLDGTSDDALTVGCAGSDHTFLRLPLRAEDVPGDQVGLRVQLSGARGGHSGADIATGRVSAIKALGRVLSAGYTAAPLRLGSIEGGVSRNAIPREAHGLVVLPAAAEAAFRSAAEDELAAIVRQTEGTDDELVVSVERTGLSPAADADTTRRALDLLAAIPTGVLALTPELSGVVQTSTCLTTAGTESGLLTLASMSRSSNAAALDGLLASMESLARLSGAEIEVRRSYPPWEPKLDSRLLETAKATYARLFGAEPTLTVVHGGLECAVLGQKLPGVEMVSIGPEIVGPHAPGEKLRISSTQRFYRLLGALLDDLSR